jgi:hypothetical protein
VRLRAGLEDAIVPKRSRLAGVMRRVLESSPASPKIARSVSRSVIPPAVRRPAYAVESVHNRGEVMHICG